MLPEITGKNRLVTSAIDFSLCRATKRFDVIVEPDRSQSFDHFRAAVAEAFEFDVGVVDVVFDEGGVKVADGW
jgi:hypothetical protein